MACSNLGVRGLFYARRKIMGTKPSVKVGQVWSCGDGDIEVLEYLSCKEVKVRFLSTGYERWTWAQSIKKGHVKDRVKAQLDIESRVNVDRKLSVMYEALYAKKRFEEHEQIFKDSNMHLYKHIVKNSVWPTNSYGKIRIIKEVDGFRVTVYFFKYWLYKSCI